MNLILYYFFINNNLALDKAAYLQGADSAEAVDERYCLLIYFDFLGHFNYSNKFRRKHCGF